jgi:hypothetical protein
MATKRKQASYSLKKPPFSCSVVGSNGQCIALPHKLSDMTEHLSVKLFGKVVFEIDTADWDEQAITHRHQADKFGRGKFLMSYFKIKDEKKDVQFPLYGKPHEHKMEKVTNIAGTHVRCVHCGEFPPKEKR